MKKHGSFLLLVVRRVAMLCVLGLVAVRGMAVDVDSLMRSREQHEPLSRFSAYFQAGLNTADDVSLAFELGAAWYPLRYAGLSFGVEFDDNNGNKSLFESSDSFYDDYDPSRIIRLNFHPSLAFRTPPVWLGKRRKVGLLLQCNPGLVISVPRNDTEWVSGPAPMDDPRTGEKRIGEVRRKLKNRDGEWLAWRVRTSVGLCNDDGAISLGWSVSNYNIESCRNNLYHQGKRVGGRNHLSMTHSLFINLTYFF